MAFKLLLVYIFTLPFLKMPLIILDQRLQLSEVVFLFLFILWLLGLIKNKRLPQESGINKQLLLFICFCLLSFLNTPHLFLSIAELSALIYLFVVLILTTDVIDTRRKLDIAVKVWIGALVVVLLLAFIGLCISIITGEMNTFCRVRYANFPYLNAVYRVQSTFRYPETLTNYLIVGLGFIMSELLVTDNKRYKLFLKITILFMYLIAVATVARGILYFIFSFFLIYNHFYKTNDIKFKIFRFLSISFMIAMFLFIMLFCSSFYIRSCQIKNRINFNYAHEQRLVNKIAALEMVKRHPFLGVGLGMFPSYIQNLNSENYFKNFVPIYYDTSDDTNGFIDHLPKGDAHNDILQYLAEIGILGGGAFLLFIGSFLYLIFTNLKKETADSEYFKVRLFCFFASFAGVLLESIDLNVFKARHLWVLMALTLALIRIYGKNNKQNKLIIE